MRRTETFGVAGSSPGVGVTHFALLLANYLHGVVNRRIAVLEWNTSGDFERINKICLKNSVSKQGADTFKHLEVFYIKNAGKMELFKYANQEFDAVVIDFGHDFTSIREEFSRCDRKIMMGSCCEWKLEAFAEIIAGKRKMEGRWDYLTVSGDKETIRALEEALHISVGQIPEASDAFAVTGATMAFFKEFLQY